MKNIQISFFGRKYANVPWSSASSNVKHHLYYIYGGTAYYTGGASRKKLEKNKIYIIPYLGNYSYLEQDDSDPLHLIAVDFTIYPVISATSFLEIDVDSDPILQHYIKIIEIFCPNEPTVYSNHDFTFPSSKIVLELRETLKVYIGYVVTMYNIDTCTDERINKAIKFINENCEKNITVNRIASEVGLNEKYFISVFKDKISVSPHKYLIFCRISKADMLMDSGFTVSEAAFAVGYTDLSAFSNTYKKIKGYSPKEYWGRNL